MLHDRRGQKTNIYICVYICKLMYNKIKKIFMIITVMVSITTLVITAGMTSASISSQLVMVH